MKKRLYKIKVPFIAYDEVEIEIDEDGESDDETYEELALDQAKDEVWNKIKHKIERVEFFSHVEGSFNNRYGPELVFKEEIEFFTDEEDEIKDDE
jgi:hypothetical protein